MYIWYRYELRFENWIYSVVQVIRCHIDIYFTEKSHHLVCMLSSCFSYSSTLNTDSTCSSGMSVGFQRTTPCCIPEDRTVDKHRCETLGDSRIWDNKMGLRWRGPVAIVNYRPILLSERMLHKDYNRKCSVGKLKLWSWVSRGLSPRRTDWWYTTSRKVTLISPMKYTYFTNLNLKIPHTALFLVFLYFRYKTAGAALIAMRIYFITNMFQMKVVELMRSVFHMMWEFCVRWAVS
jgi:hypothetical protein